MGNSYTIPTPLLHRKSHTLFYFFNFSFQPIKSSFGINALSNIGNGMTYNSFKGVFVYVIIFSLRHKTIRFGPMIIVILKSSRLRTRARMAGCDTSLTMLMVMRLRLVPLTTIGLLTITSIKAAGIDEKSVPFFFSRKNLPAL